MIRRVLRESKKAVAISLLALVVTLLASEAKGCRYTVRDIGFSPLSRDSWTLLNFGKEREDISRWLENSSVEELRVNRASIPSNLTAHFNALNGAQYRLINQREVAKGYNIKSIREIKESPIRELLKSKLKSSFATILIIDKGDGKGAEIEKIVESQLKGFIDTMILMPKEVKEHPQTLLVHLDRYSSDRSLFSMMGVDITSRESSAVVIYGRGRMIGAPLNKAEVASGDAIKLLNIIGSDCECGLDRKWLLGTLLPMSWEDVELKAISRKIEIDIQNPMTLIEMQQIVSKEVSRAGDSREITFAPHESDLGKTVKREESIPSASFQDMEEYMHEDGSVKLNWWYILGAILLIIVIISATIVVKNSRDR